jgi:hypothetical protein
MKMAQTFLNDLSVFVELFGSICRLQPDFASPHNYLCVMDVIKEERKLPKLP